MVGAWVLSRRSLGRPRVGGQPPTCCRRRKGDTIKPDHPPSIAVDCACMRRKCSEVSDIGSIRRLQYRNSRWHSSTSGSHASRRRCGLRRRLPVQKIRPNLKKILW